MPVGKETGAVRFNPCFMIRSYHVSLGRHDLILNILVHGT